jgi:quercetin dioxygenase-like cupin family protein
MTTDQQQGQATLYVLGALGADEQRAFEAELRVDAELRELVRSLQRAANLLAMTAPQIVPPAELKKKIFDRIESVTDKGKHAIQDQGFPSAAKPCFVFHGADEAKGWKELPVRGAWIKLLSLEKDRNYAILLGKLEAGVRYPAHTHPSAEELYILTGDLHIGDRTLGPGDFHHADAGTAHGVNYSVEGCTLLAVLPADHDLVQFAMA